MNNISVGDHSERLSFFRKKKIGLKIDSNLFDCLNLTVLLSSLINIFICIDIFIVLFHNNTIIYTYELSYF